MGSLIAKYWKGYYISKSWSDLKCSKEEKDKIVVKLYKEAADYGSATSLRNNGYTWKRG